MKKKIDIIGAGIAGLSTGCYLQMNGYDTEIFELHKQPGGLCTSWKRKDFTIDGCLHWLVGSSPGDAFHGLWNELVDMKSLTFVEYEEFIRVEDDQGRFIRVLTDIEQFEAELLIKAPEDKKAILEFTGAVKKFTRFNLPLAKAPEVMTLLDGLKMMVKMLPYFPSLRKWVAITAGQFAEHCNNELLKRTFLHMFLPEMAFLFLIMTMAWMNKKSAGYPIGGSLNFSRLIEKRYLQLGGKIHYVAKVEKIVTENDAAKGIVLANGQTHKADRVISAADGHSTIFKMLGAKYLNDTIRAYYDGYEIFPSYLQVSLGIRGTFDGQPQTLVFPLDEPLVVDDRRSVNDLSIRILGFDPTLAPPGRSLFISMLTTPNCLYWERLRRMDAVAYQAEKDRIANAVIHALEIRFGHIRENVEMVDVATPATVMRYTNNWKGSFEGWVITPQIGFKEMKKTLPGLDDFFMAGQWVQPGGGVPTGLLSGRNVTQIICKQDGKKFVTTHF